MSTSVRTYTVGEPKYGDPEPFYIAQTFEFEDVSTKLARMSWFVKMAKEAEKGGATFARYTVADDQGGLLIECWKGTPKEQGEPRWQMTMQAPMESKQL